MYITWSDLISIIELIYDIKPVEIAQHLGVSASTIIRIKNKETGRLSARTLEEVYTYLFDPSNAPKKNIEEDMLCILKDAIEKLGLRDAMNDLWKYKGYYKEGDYEIFVKEMLKRVVSNHETISSDSSDSNENVESQLSKDDLDALIIANRNSSTNQIDVIDDDDDTAWVRDLLNAKRPPYLTDEETDKVRKVFIHSVRKYKIVKFILCGVHMIPEDELSKKIKSFQFSINRRILARFNKGDGEDKIISDIGKFMYYLEKYIASSTHFLSAYSHFYELTDDCRDQLISLLYEICDIEEP